MECYKTQLARWRIVSFCRILLVPPWPKLACSILKSEQVLRTLFAGLNIVFGVCLQVFLIFLRAFGVCRTQMLVNNTTFRVA